MAAESFSRFLTDNATRKTYHAPTGTYWIDTPSDIQAVMTAAQRAAFSIDSTAEIAVSGPAPIRFCNCREQLSLGAMLSLFAKETKPASPSLRAGKFTPYRV